jgi:hypothetical protein
LASRKSSFVVPQNPTDDEVAALLAIEKALGGILIEADAFYPIINAVAVAYLRSLPYDVYLQTRHWQSFRRLLLQWRGRVCEVCGATDREIHIHHLTYKTLGEEGPGDVRVLCADCHARLHGKLPKGGD